MSAADWLRLLAEHAAALRAAGVVEFSFEGASVKLSPPDQVIRFEDDGQALVESADPFDDPLTYGLPPGSPIPGRFNRRRNEGAE